MDPDFFYTAWDLGSQLLADALVHVQMHKSVFCAIFVHYLVFIELVFYHKFLGSMGS